MKICVPLSRRSGQLLAVLAPWTAKQSAVLDCRTRKFRLNFAFYCHPIAHTLLSLSLQWLPILPTTGASATQFSMWRALVRDEFQSVGRCCES